MKAGLAPLRFGDFELDVRRGELRQGDRTISLQEQSFQILLMLLECDGEIVSREEIQKRLWPDDTVVEFDQSINAAIKKLRKALGDSADEPLYIRTVAKQGYRLIVPVQPIGKNGVARESVPGQIAASSKVSTETRYRWWWTGVAVVIFLAAGVGGILYWRSHRAPKLTDQDTIVLTDFVNSVGDPVFDDTLKQALSAQLSQSPFFNVLPDRKIRGALKELNHPTNAVVTEDVARQVCQHIQGRAVVTGSIGALGKEYILILRTVDCNTRDVLAEAQERAPEQAAVINALDEAALSIRKQLGEPLTSVRNYATPLAEATTPSLEAWKAYTMGMRAQFKQGMTASLPFLKRAVELDPNFAKAYYSLSVAYGNLDEGRRAEEYGREAYQLRSRVSQRERFAIDTNYYLNVTGELDKAQNTLELWRQSFPRESSPYGNLGLVYNRLGNLEAMLTVARQAIRLQRNNAIPYLNLAAAYANLNRLEDAEQALKDAELHNVSVENMLQFRYLFAFYKGDTTQMAQMVSMAEGKPGTEDLLLASQSDTEAWYGRLKDARKSTEAAVRSAQHNDAHDLAASYLAGAALREIAMGNRQQARSNAFAALRLSSSFEVKELAATALAQVGDIPTAHGLVDGLNVDRPMDTLVQRYWLPSIRAAIALDGNDPNKAVKLLKGMGALELGDATRAVEIFLCPVYLRGQAFLMLHDGKAAEAEFKKFLEHYGLVGNFVWGALARLGLARAYALEAQTDPAYREKARTAYQNFLTLWKDADPDIPIYRQARSEYAKLQ